MNYHNPIPEYMQQTWRRENSTKLLNSITNNDDERSTLEGMVKELQFDVPRPISPLKEDSQDLPSYELEIYVTEESSSEEEYASEYIREPSFASCDKEFPEYVPTPKNTENMFDIYATEDWSDVEK